LFYIFTKNRSILSKTHCNKYFKGSEHRINVTAIKSDRTRNFEITLKLSIIIHYIDRYCKLFVPSTDPGHYKTPLGRKRAVSWEKRTEKKNFFELLFISLAAPFMGAYGLSQNHDDVFSLLLIFWGFGTAILLGWKQFSKNRENENRIAKLENKLNEFKRN